MQKIYRLREKTPEAVNQALAAHPEIVRDLLHIRGITDAEAAEQFLSPSFERDSHDPFLMPDMDIAVERIRRAAHAGEYISVWSDYDCDGIPGGVALTEFLRAIGCRVRHYIPHRHEEGYGLNIAGLSELAAEGIKLIITVDLGTSDVLPVAHARELGMEVIIADHHLPQEIMPDALAILNPYRADSKYPFQHLCGAGVAWKLMQGVLARERFGLPEGKEKWLLDLVGLATLSDMVPLVDENRMLASYGLLVIRRNRRPGLQALLKLLRINPRTLTEDDLTFMVSPRINAASRMESPETAARLLASQDADESAELAKTLNRINDERKGAVAATVKEARSRLKKTGAVKSNIIVMGNPKWRPGILGLVANSLMESEGVPVFLWGREGSEMLKGSCRSNTLNVVDIMSATGGILAGFGGHEFAGGFSMQEERAHELEPHLASAYESLLSQGTPQKEIPVDKELSLEEIPQTLRQVNRLSPFGEGNRKPLFMFPNVSISRMRTFGKANDHLELFLSGAGATETSGISFFSTPESFQKNPTEGVRADIVGHVEIDFRGRPRLRVVDIL